MNIRHTYHLTDKQIMDAEELLRAEQGDCKSAASFPLEDGSSFYLLYQTKQETPSSQANQRRQETPISQANQRGQSSRSSQAELVCILALILPDPEQEGDGAECYAFTHPDERQKGYFTRLFKAAMPEFDHLDLLFPVNPSCIHAVKALNALGAELICSEYRMDAALDRRRPVPIKTERRDGEPLQLSPVLTRQCLSLSFRLASRHIGACKVSVSEKPDDCACLYEFEILSELRGKGFGTEALSLALDFLKGQGIRRLFLHVSGDNLPALKLYKKTGFQITEALSYYLY